MTNPEERIGKIEETIVPELEALKSRLDAFILGRPDLQAKIEVIKSPHFKTENLPSMVESWNKDNSVKLTRPYVEREFLGAKGERLKIRMDMDGNMMLACDLLDVKK